MSPCVICREPEQDGAPHSPSTCALNLRAEIEWLRSALREIADGGSDCPCVDDALWALEGKP